MPYIEYLQCECNDVDEFNDAASQFLDDLCLELEKDESNKIKIDTEQHPEAEHYLFYWSRKACDTIDAEIAALYGIGEKYFDLKDLDISSTYYRED